MASSVDFVGFSENIDINTEPGKRCHFVRGHSWPGEIKFKIHHPSKNTKIWYDQVEVQKKYGLGKTPRCKSKNFGGNCLQIFDLVISLEQGCKKSIPKVTPGGGATNNTVECVVGTI